MKQYQYIPDVVDFAQQILRLHDENCRLKDDVERLEKIREQYQEFLHQQQTQTIEQTGMIFNAILDPESNFNKGLK